MLCRNWGRWNAIYVPAEQGPVLPVDRSWDLAKQPTGPDWMYTMFQWDNHFASLMVAMDNETAAMELAISNFICTVKSTKTAEGFGSNYGAAAPISRDLLVGGGVHPLSCPVVLAPLHTCGLTWFPGRHGPCLFFWGGDVF